MYNLIGNVCSYGDKYMPKRIVVEGWQQDFILLTYPTTEIKDIASILGRHRLIVSRFIDKVKRKINKKHIKEGDIFGKLKVIKIVKVIKGKGRLISCECSCKNKTKINVLVSSLLNGHTQSCGCKHVDTLNKTYNNITGTWFNYLKKGALNRDLEFNITKEYLDALLIKQNFKCKLSGIPIKIGSYRIKDDITASLDRIDNNKGYIEGNVQFVHKYINYMKWTHNQEYFIELCKKVTENN